MSVVKMRPRTFPEKHPCSRCLKTGSTFDISITHLPGSLAVGLAIWSTPQTPCTGPRAPSLAPVSVGRRRLTAPPFRRLPWLAGAPAPWRDRHPGEEAQSLRQTPGPGRLMLPGLRQSARPPEHRPHPPPRASPPRGPRGSRACFCPPPCCDCLVRASFLHQTGRNGRLTSECPASKTLLGSYHLCDRVCRVERRRGTSASAFVANGLPQPDGRGGSVVRSLTCQHPYLLRNVYATFK